MKKREELIELLEEAAEQIDSCYSRETDLTNRIYDAINAESESSGGGSIQQAIKAVVDSMDEELANTVRGKGVDWIIASIREKAAEPKARELTLDELREMDGQPVWVKEITEKLIDGDYWGIVCLNHPATKKQGIISVPTIKAHAAITLFSDFGKTWIAYDRCPSENKP